MMSANLGVPSARVRPATHKRRESSATGSGHDTHRFKKALKDARTGLIEAQVQVGLMLAAGAGTRQNITEALVWMTRAAERGHAGAQFMLGSHFAAEPGTAPRGQRDEARAMDWLYLAARQGHARAHHRLAQLLRQAGPDLGAHHEAAAASLGLAESQLALARRQLQPGTEAELHSSGRAWLRRAAEQGLAAAQTELGIRCLDDSSFGSSPQEGLEWLRAAAAQGWPPALLELHHRSDVSPALPQPVQDPVDASARHALGQLHALGAAGLPVNPQQASHWLGLAASQNCPQAHTALGQLAEVRDPQAALQHYQAGAQAGDAAAQTALARLLRQPGRSAAEQLQAQRWLVMAAHAGHAEAMLDWAETLEKSDPELARTARLHAAQAGLAQAQFRWAQSLLKSPASEDQREAGVWLERAVAQGQPAARRVLGLWLRNGPDDVRDESRGLRLLQEAAAGGDPSANWNLALIHAAGAVDVPRDPATALSLCRNAADTGFVPAMATMGVLCATLDRPEEAAHWWRQAAQAGDLEAQFNLAQALGAGRGVERDESQAFGWMLQAAESGLVQAQAELAVLYATGRGVAIDAIEAHKWFFVARLGGSRAAARNTDQSRKLLSPAQAQEGERRARSWRARHKRRD